MVKVKRSWPAPASLEKEKKKKSGTYRTDEVIQRLNADFHNKCYICEMKGLQAPEIEHRLPHHNGEDRDRMFDWNNLFLACSHCNKVKNRKKYESGIIDCCQSDPEQSLLLRVMEDEVIAELKTETEDAEILNTKMLLNDVFNKDVHGMRTLSCKEKYNELLCEMNAFYRLLEKYDKPDHSEDMEMEMKEILSRESPFAQFKRDYIRSKEDEYPDLVRFM